MFLYTVPRAINNSQKRYENIIYDKSRLRLIMHLAKKILKAELAFQEVSHQELCHRLNKLGLKETKASIDNKISRGTFSADFLIYSLLVLGRSEVPLYTNKLNRKAYEHCRGNGE